MTNRNIVHKVTRQYMAKNKKRTLTTMLGIMLMVMLMTCVFVGKDTAVNYLEELASQEKGRWHMSVYDITRKEYDAITKLDFVEETAISADLGYAEFTASANIERPFIFIKSYQKNGFDMMNIRAVEGRLPENGSEIVLSTAALEDGERVTSGGRVLGVTAVAPTLAEAVEASYDMLDRIDFANKYYRVDIGQRALKALG